MPNERNNGGPAFPARTPPLTDMTGADATSGMTLRDWFAGQALSAIPLRNWNMPGVSDEEIIELWAKCAYRCADAMLAAREGARHD